MKIYFLFLLLGTIAACSYLWPQSPRGMRSTNRHV